MKRITSITKKECQYCHEQYIPLTCFGIPNGVGSVNWKKRKYCSKSCAMKVNRGTKPTVLGKSWTVKTTRRPLGIHPKSEFKKGMSPWNKGRPMSDQAKKKLSDVLTGRSTPLKGRKRPDMSRENNPAWRGGVSSFDKLQRAKFRKEMQRLVFERDDYTCLLCGVRGVDLQVDHIQSWAEYVELRFCIDNCRTLCASCHYKITFGKPMPPTIRAWGHNLFKGGIKL